MKKVHLDIPVVNIENKELKDEQGRTLTVKSAIANVLMQGTSNDPIRITELARKIYASNKSIEIEDADMADIVKIVKEARLVNIVKGKIYEALEIKK